MEITTALNLGSLGLYLLGYILLAVWAALPLYIVVAIPHLLIHKRLPFTRKRG